MRIFTSGLVVGLLAGASGCGGLQLKLQHASVQKPSNVVLYFAVEDSRGQGVPALAADAFKIYEDDQLVSPFESKQTILNPEVAVSHYVLLLVDLSGSITESGSLPALTSAVSAFVERVSKSQVVQIAVYGFDGSPKLTPLVGFTRQGLAVSSAMSWLTGRKAKDPSTNLNGAIVEGVSVLEKQVSKSNMPLRFATMVVFTDGTDRAHRVAWEKVEEKVDQAQVNLYAIGLGAELSEDHLSKIGRAGYVKAERQEDMNKAFEEMATKIESAGRKYYLLSYCSPSRAGTHRLRVEATTKEGSGDLSREFKAEGFGPNCDPNQKPNFSPTRILIEARRKEKAEEKAKRSE
ncbi:MAG: VWA domain-containing protein [Deltaproteobacteria bacterium]|nr:VWA domain-containing protein [Deltaproteobacteria bacterium]